MLTIKSGRLQHFARRLADAMDTASRTRKHTVLAQQMIVGLGSVNEPPFRALAQYYPEHGFWAAEDRELNGEPRLIPLHTFGWIC